jgi:tetratricopeptide (TPR) repeat protein
MSFVHVWRRTDFLVMQLAVPADDFVKAAAPLVEMHPYRQFLATYTIDPAARIAAWEKLTIPEPDDLEFQAARMWLQYRQRHLPAASDMVMTIASRLDATPRDYNQQADVIVNLGYSWWCDSLLRNSPFSPVAAAIAVEFCGDDYKPRFAEWEEAAADYPVLALAFARRAVAAARWEKAEKWFKLVASTGDMDGLRELAKVYALQGKMDRWVATLEDSLKGPDYGLDHALAQSNIARYYMHLKRWEKALPYAKGAAESYAGWALQILAECHEAMGHWTEAEAIFKAESERYPDAIVEWYAFCRRTGRGDLASARRLFAEATGLVRISGTPSSLAYYLLEKDPARAKQLLRHLAADGNPVYDMHLALLADQAHDASTRDRILDRVQRKGSAYKPRQPIRRTYANLAALAGLIAGDLAKGGKGPIDQAAAERLSPPAPFDADQGCCRGDEPAAALSYLLGRYLDQHGKPELAVCCWKHCLAQTDAMSDLHRTLAAAELLARGVRLPSEESHVEKDAETPKSQP